MKLFLGKKVGVSKEEKALSYYKFFERDMANISAEKIALLDAPQEKSAVPFEGWIYNLSATAPRQPN